ncbi:MAG: 1-deoxy-D-xylulose-5-phosphate reductoisomerase [Planctomycetota bacterium]
MIRLALVGATGSIGRSTLDVVRALPDRIELVGVFAGRDAAGVEAVAAEFGVRHSGLKGSDRLPAALDEADVVLNAASGAAGLPVSVETLRRGKRLALANKESLVAAGPLLMRLAREHGGAILPVDSEHSAVFQALQAGRREEIERVLLTASGGPFRTWSAERIASATPADALNHPTWAMGEKITIDSATLMNKALELIEARWLFDLPAERLDVVVHPQSIVHSMVEFRDGSVVAQMGQPDMRVPIQYALTWPERCDHAFTRFRVADYSELTFEEPDRQRFGALALAEKALQLGGTAGAVLNAANEVAVERFLAGDLPFPAITETVASVLEDAAIKPEPDLDDIYAADQAAREDTAKCRI